jgi:hypothetical protein
VSRRLTIVLSVLGLGVAVASAAALRSGVQEARLILSGPRRQSAAENLPTSVNGWWAVAGCVRHDRALGVNAAGRVYRLGSESASEGGRVFTPLSARDDCDEDRPPRRLYALVEDDEALSNTIGHVYAQAVAPPPVLAVVDGTIGFSTGHAQLAERAAARWVQDGLPVDALPLLVKGRRPGVLWVALTTAAFGAHGVLLLGLGLWWATRRARRDDAEAQFFRGA